MKVSFNTNNQNNFGMALHMNENAIEHIVGKEMADAARNVRSILEKIPDCDIYIGAEKGNTKETDCFTICLKDFTKRVYRRDADILQQSLEEQIVNHVSLLKVADI